MSQGGSSGVRLLVRPGRLACLALPVPRQACPGLARAALAVPSRVAISPERASTGGASSFPSGPLPASWLSPTEGALADVLADSFADSRSGTLRRHRVDPGFPSPAPESGGGWSGRDAPWAASAPGDSVTGLALAESLIVLWWRLLSSDENDDDQAGGSTAPVGGSEGGTWARVCPGACRTDGVPLVALAGDLVSGPLPADVIDVDEVSWLAWGARSPAAADPVSQGLAWAERLRRGDLPAPRVPGPIPLTAEGGEVLAAVRLAADHVRLALTFQDALGEARLDAIRELAYGAGHEINNPLANIATRAQTLLLDERDPERRRRLSTIVDQAFRARDLIGGLMLFARPPRPSRAATDLHGMVSGVVALLGSLAAQRLARLDYVPPPLPISVSVDRSQIEEALRAVISNALEALDDGGQVTVTVSTGRRGGGCDIVVADNGHGIDAATLRRVFDPFFSGREAGRGAGFGLSKAWRFFEANGGSIEIESRAGRGTRVLVRLPTAEAGSLPQRDAADRIEANRERGEDPLSLPVSLDRGVTPGKVAAEPPA